MSDFTEQDAGLLQPAVQEIWRLLGPLFTKSEGDRPILEGMTRLQLTRWIYDNGLRVPRGYSSPFNPHDPLDR